MTYVQRNAADMVNTHGICHQVFIVHYIVATQPA